MPKAIVECVPNFSEGRDQAKIEAIARAIRSVPGVALLDVDPGADTNRTVYTFVGAPEAVRDAALQAASVAHELIDMRVHQGAHPRMGALDVCPFVPVAGISMEECTELARDFGQKLAAMFDIPVYLYEKAATRPERQSLADIRAGEYEGLPAKLADPAWIPDFGPARFDPRWGATVTGAREFLIAYNVNLNTRDKKLANDIAFAVREAGRTIKNPDGTSIKVPGRLKAVRAIGWYIEQYGCAQVSINLLDYRTTPLHAVYDAVKEEAEKRGLYVTGSELVGLVPLNALKECGQYYLSKAGKSPGLSDRELVDLAVQTLGLRSVQPFDPSKKIVEWAMASPGPLVSMKVDEFVDLVSSDSPAPGGGSVAALAGALGAALAAMDANLTVGKKGYEAHYPRLSELAVQAQTLKKALVDAIDEDTAAFNAVMEAMRLPKATDAQKAARDAALDAAQKQAALVPLTTARHCLQTMKLAAETARLGNTNSVTDAATGCHIAYAGLKGALMNVKINLISLQDGDFVSSLRKEAESLAQEGQNILEELEAFMKEALA